MPQATSDCEAVGKSTDCDVEWFYGRFVAGRSLALLVSDYTELGVAVAAGDVRL
ncbi:hypothetical protein [Pseudomonas weihenstephanensis]|uniref:Uncharacterized protein n=1 Tax=Pseudomonas weihenstephanensis TaxID=1608994 RepID=A0ABS1ZKK4_9PSED|nr:hypothetical protein [Pseudomonas weihenstephanensis]MBM1196970.1 hypothetical protein [Pseudomonas weihenstephanensis]